jgi:GTP-binding protein
MIAADSADIKKDYEILLHELEKYNPELLDKKRILAITKSDLLDSELKKEMQKELPANVTSVFISSIAHDGLEALKDLLWAAISNE